LTVQLRESDKPLRNLISLSFKLYQTSQNEDNLAPLADVNKSLRRFLCDLLESQSILQVVRIPAIAILRDFADGQDCPNLSALIPGLGAILQSLNQLPTASQLLEPLMIPLRSFAAYLANRCESVFEGLRYNRQTGGILIDCVSPVTSEDWKKTGSCYGHSPLRRRPIYEGIDEKDTVHEGREAGRCQKFYSTYGKQKFTGGVMAFWCKHLTCLGFHIMPRAEGRNDVFSALYTYWPEAPKVIIYDFACQLSQYCMVREPEFFKDTLFVIDRMHAAGHVGCSESSFLSHHERTNPSLLHVNSQAAECGNSGLARIRKSIAYMNEDRAILYCWVYIMIWNRMVLQKQEDTHDTSC
jgi:hypothetical protein